MSKSVSDLSKKQMTLDLLVTAGYDGVRHTVVSESDLLTDGLAWCTAAAVGTDPVYSELLSYRNTSSEQDRLKVLQVTEAALRSVGCPHSFQVQQIEDLDYNGIYPVVQWVVELILTVQTKNKSKDEATYVMKEIEREEHTAKQLKMELDEAKSSIKIMSTDLYEQNLKKIHKLKEMQDLQAKIREGDNSKVEKLTLLLDSLQEMEKKKSHFRSHLEQNHSNLQADVLQLEKKMLSYEEGKRSFNDFRNISANSLEKLNAAKRDLAVKLRELLFVKRQLDDVPSQSELIQYERRFSELHIQIQEKLQQTRKCYATYNALLEIKDLVMKETSLLNSILAQFKDAISNPAGRMKLIDSMEGIVKGTEQKLTKVDLGLQNEQKFCDSLKENYAGLIAEQRRFSSLLKTFQEECTKSEKLRRQTSA